MLCQIDQGEIWFYSACPRNIACNGPTKPLQVFNLTSQWAPKLFKWLNSGTCLWILQH